IYYAAEKERMEGLLNSKLRSYKKVAKEMDPGTLALFNGQFICHRIFRESGHIQKYLNRPEIKSLDAAQTDFLKFQANHPMKYSFATILRNPADDFFEMEDELTGEKFLLYSPGLGDTYKNFQPLMWFILISFNGQCWQTYGPIIPFNSFSVDDIFFFATELNPMISSHDDLLKEVSDNTFPFFMLSNYSSIPSTKSKGYPIVHCASTDRLDSFSTENLNKDFVIEWNKDIYKIAPKRFSGFPHFATAYYNEKKKELLRIALTEKGFEKLSQMLTKAGIESDPVSDIAVSPGMLLATEKILGKKIALHPYENNFKIPEQDLDPDELNRMNEYLRLLLPYINSNTKTDIEKLADQVGISRETALELWEKSKKYMDRMNDGK
ncbi:MAG: hypothetical protein ACKOA1_10560, partial [Bacteroidota bacterium]